MQLEGIESFCGSKFWDANITWHTDSPEFTPCFEQTALIWLPIIFLWLFLPLDLYITLHTKLLKIPWNNFNLSKIAANCLLILLVIFDLGYNLSGAIEMYPVVYWTPIFQLIGYFLSLTLTIVHVRRGQNSSGCLFLFWILSVISNSHAFRTDIRAFQNHTFTAINISDTISYITKIVLLILNIFADKTVLDPSVKEKKRVLPLNYSSAISKFTMSWYDRLAFLGFRRPLVMTDIWDLDREMKCEETVKKLEYYWERANKKKRSKRNKDDIISIFWPSFRGFLPDYIICNLLKLIAEMFAFASPLLLKQMLRFVKTDDSNWKGFMLAILMVIASVVQSCLSSNSQLLLYHFGIKAKVALTSALFKKGLYLSNKAKSESSFGEIVNIMSIDCDKLMESVYYAQFIWLAPLQIIVTFILLWQMMGPAVIAGFAIMFILLPVNFFFAKKIHAIQTKQMATKDTRIKCMNEILSGIKVIKLNAWEPTFEQRISEFRDGETNNLKQISYLSSIMSCFWSCATCFMLLSTFTVYVLSDDNNMLDVETAFTSIALFNIIYNTMFMVPYFISFITQAKVSSERINKFMNSEELVIGSVTHNIESDQLVMEKCSFSWDDGSNSILKDINLRIKPGSLVAIVGPVGSGKSSLISAFLGEMNKISGRVNTMGSIAYVPQVAWIQNETVRNNILFGSKYSSSMYKKVVKACALTEDFEMLPDKDHTEIGEKGINLSGGQKQRVSLARAVYNNADVYFLDDPLSAVDSLVGRHIFTHLIGSKGLLRKKTRILVTHLVSCLPEMDCVVVLKDGRISAMGTYHELMNKNTMFKEFILNHSQGQTSIEAESEFIEADQDCETAPLMSNGIRRDSEGCKSIASVASEKAQINAKGEMKGKLVEAELTETGEVNIKVFQNYIHAMGLKWWIAIVVFCFIKQSFTIGGNYWISVWSNDQSIAVNGSENTGKRDMYLGIYSSIIFFQAVASYMSEIVPLIACLKAAIYLHSTLLKAILKAPLHFFDTTPLGRIISRFSKDVESLDTGLPIDITQTINCIFEFIGIIVVISYSSPIFLLVMIPIAVLYYFIRKFYILSSTQIRRLVSITRSPIYSHFSETLSGVSIIRAFRQQERFIRESQEKIDLNIKAYYTATVANRWLSVRLETLGNIVIFFAAVSAVLTKGDSNAGIIGMSLTYSLMITRVLLLLMRWSAETELFIVSAERIKEYCDVEQEKPWDLPTAISRDWPNRGEVIFKDFSFRYRQGLDLVLKSVSFTVHPGEKVGIVGRSGAGKSSLTLSLFRIIESAGGAILIDGVDISTVGLHRLRQSLNIISQDPVLFSGSLRLNLDPQGKYSDDKLWKSIELAHLKSFVSSLTHGLQYEILEGGSNLSVGQRQQVCLARALLNKTKILIMDEATAAIDLETDDLIQKTIRNEFSDCTVLTIAHRIHTIMDSDRVLVMDGGVVAEYDTPSNLLANQESLFSCLANQAGIEQVSTMFS